MNEVQRHNLVAAPVSSPGEGWGGKDSDFVHTLSLRHKTQQNDIVRLDGLMALSDAQS